MGDGITDEPWYPYVQVVTAINGDAQSGRKHFKTQDEHWVHVSQIQDGDTVRFMPSCFTWLFLDTSARRFEAGKTVQPPDELSHITELWRKLKDLANGNRLSDTQLHSICTLLGSKADAWKRRSEPFGKLAEAVIFKEGLGTVTLEDLTSRRLEATFELYHHILKQKLKEDEA